MPQEIKQRTATGHDICDICSKIRFERARFEHRTDDESVRRRQELDEEQAAHNKDHRGEREYAKDLWYKGVHYPERVTALNMDAPTEYQFDVPVQTRKCHDGVKSLAGAEKWKSKMTGVLVSGAGMCSYITRHGLGSGPNLSCTCLYLSLLTMVKQGRPIGVLPPLLLPCPHAPPPPPKPCLPCCSTVLTPLLCSPLIGSHVNVLLDNTCGDNKNNEMIFFLAWLVQTNVCQEASFFCMMVGHTYSRIDRHFSTLITLLFTVSIYTVSQLTQYIFQFLAPYNPSQVVEMHCLWDWKAFFAPHVHGRFGGFSTSQYG